MAKRIKFIFRDGQTSLQTTGFTGSSCKAASAPYEKALGEVTEDFPTSDRATTQQQTEVKQLDA